MEDLTTLRSKLSWAFIPAIASILVPGVGLLTLLCIIWAWKDVNAAVDQAIREKETKTDAQSMKEQAEAIKKQAQAIKKKAEAAAAETMSNLADERARFSDEKREHEIKMQELKTELSRLSQNVVIAAASFYDLENITSEEIKNRLVLLENKEKTVLANKYSFMLADTANKALNDNIKQIIRCFTSECKYLISTINYKNIDAVRGKISKSFTILNKLFAVDNVTLPEELLSIKLEEARLVYAFHERKEQEREQQQAIKAQMLEEEKVRREIENEKKKIDKEERQFKAELDRMMKYLQKAVNDVERQIYVDKIKELEEKLNLLQKDKENVLEREQNTRAGFVYVISNIGSFGEDIYKIGMTRRLEPMDRIKELSSASVPFEFDVHAMIFSDDAPALENILHETFRAKEVNKVNHRKEFFKVDLAEIERVVKKHHNATVTFTMLAEARQYRESLKIAQGIA